MKSGKDILDKRIEKIVKKTIELFKLDLSGLTVFTETATNDYMYTPIIAALSGADKVYALTKNSKYGLREEIKSKTIRIASSFGVQNKIEVIFEKSEDCVKKSDIFTNSGFVRPIDQEMISWMKPTAVIPLMWETWEFRDSDIDLEACRKKGVLVMGTNEHEPPCDMAPYSGFMGMKLLFDLGLEGCHTKILLLGGQATLGGAIYRHLKSVGCDVNWFVSRASNSAKGYEGLKKKFEKSGADYDAILVAEHSDSRCLLGIDGFISFEQISNINPSIRIGIIAGNISVQELNRSGLFHLPEKVRPFGYLSYQPGVLGPRPILELYAAGLKVGESMARARLSGATVSGSAIFALKHSPAMDFEGDKAWR